MHHEDFSGRKCRRMRDPSPEWYFRELNQAHRNASDALFTHLGIREYGQPIILFILDREYHNLPWPTQKELAEKMGVSPTTTTISLKSLERQGCVRKVSDENDMRCKRIEITDKGRKVAKQFHRAFHIIDAAMYEGFTDEEREMISGLHRKMTENLYRLSDHYINSHTDHA